MTSASALREEFNRLTVTEINERARNLCTNLTADYGDMRYAQGFMAGMYRAAELSDQAFQAIHGTGPGT